MEDINTLTQKANSGDAVAMRKLGYEYLIGKNIQKDEKKAFQLFRAAVWEGDLNATIYCGYCCKTGAGLESLTSSQPHDTTSMVHVQELPQRNMNLPEFISTKTWVMLVLSEALIRISVANDG